MLNVCIRIRTILPLEAQVRNATTAGSRPAIFGDVITDQKHHIDNLFTDTWKMLKFSARTKGAGITKRSGIDITAAVFYYWSGRGLET